MADSTKQETGEKASRSGKLPIILTLLLLLLSGCVCAWIWNNYDNAKKKADAESSEYAALLEREKFLRSLLIISPCEAAAKRQGADTAK